MFRSVCICCLSAAEAYHGGALVANFMAHDPADLAKDLNKTNIWSSLVWCYAQKRLGRNFTVYVSRSNVAGKIVREMPMDCQTPIGEESVAKIDWRSCRGETDGRVSLALSEVFFTACREQKANLRVNRFGGHKPRFFTQTCWCVGQRRSRRRCFFGQQSCTGYTCVQRRSWQWAASVES